MQFQKVQIFSLVIFLIGSRPSAPDVQATPVNISPAVSVVWPRQDDAFSAGTLIKIKATTTGSIARVQFFAETNLIGIVTNPPFNVVWQVDILPGFLYGTRTLTAVAIDDLGARSESVPIEMYYYTGGPPQPVVEIVSPRDGAMFAEPATFSFSAEVLASTGDTGPVEFFSSTNSVGLDNQTGFLSSTSPPSSITLSNLTAGEYGLTVRYRGVNGTLCTCRLATNTIRVVKLGLQRPRIGPDGHLQCEVVTSFAGRPTIIEASPNLADWTAISTNQPSGNTFTFTESSPATNRHRFYRVRVLPE